MTAFLIVLVLVALVLLVAWLRGRADRRELRGELDGLRAEMTRQLERSELKTQHAVATSRAVHLGHVAEQLAPLLPGFAYNPKDAYHCGPVDLVVFDGLEEGGEVEIVLLDVKTGRAVATPRQRRIREAAEARRVRFEIFRPDRMAALAADCLELDGEALDVGQLAELDGQAPDAELAAGDRIDGAEIELADYDGRTIAVVMPPGDRLELGS